MFVLRLLPSIPHFVWKVLLLFSFPILFILPPKALCQWSSCIFQYYNNNNYILIISSTSSFIPLSITKVIVPNKPNIVKYECTLRFHCVLHPVHVLWHLRVHSWPTSLTTRRRSVRHQTHQIRKHLSGIAGVRSNQWTPRVSTTRILATLSTSTDLLIANLHILPTINRVARRSVHAIHAHLQLLITRAHRLRLSPPGHLQSVSHVLLRPQVTIDRQANRLYKVIVADGWGQTDQGDVVELVSRSRGVLGMWCRSQDVNLLHGWRTISQAAIGVGCGVPFSQMNSRRAPRCRDIPSIDAMRGRKDIVLVNQHTSAVDTRSVVGCKVERDRIKANFY